MLERGSEALRERGSEAQSKPHHLTTSPPHPLNGGFRAAAFIRLALPMIVSRAGLAAMGIADGIMVARHQSQQFACLSLAEGTLGRLLDIFIAFFIGGLSLVPRHFSKGDAVGARSIWLRTLPAAVALGVVGLLVGLVGKNVQLLLGQTPELAGAVGPVMAILSAGYPAALLAISAAVYLEGINRPQLVAVCVIAANILNIALNWIFIDGYFGLPAMGACGSALSTTIVRFALGAALVAIALKRGSEAEAETSSLNTSPPHHLITSLPHDQIAELTESHRAQWKLGLSAAGSVAAMVVLGSSLMIFAGWMGIEPLTVFAAGWGLAAPVALVALGLSDAAGIYVAAEAGRSGERSAASTAWSCMRTTLAPIVTLAALMAGFAGVCSRLYASDLQVRSAIVDVIPIVALIIVVDCAGFVMVASLRAMREAAWPAAIEIGSMILLVPLAAWLGFGRGLGVRGLFCAMLAAGIVRTSLLVGRFCWRTRALGGSRQTAEGGRQIEQPKAAPSLPTAYCLPPTDVSLPLAAY
jgi:MATE family multidrug resistance protein